MVQEAYKSKLEFVPQAQNRTRIARNPAVELPILGEALKKQGPRGTLFKIYIEILI